MSSLQPLLAIALAAVVASTFLTWVMLRYATARGLLDIPSERSSHAAATPRGGGVAIVVTVLAVLAMAWHLGWLPGRTATGLIVGGGLVAGIGWVDDRRGLLPGPRLLVHFAAAGVAVACFGGFGGWGEVNLIVTGFAIVWAINAYNFMDGIDGLAGSEALVAGTAAAAMLWRGGDAALALAVGVMAASAGGFLIWNWPPARIFMGDVGSGFLGFLAGALALAADTQGRLPVSCWLLLFGVFAFDATVTLVRRALRGQRLTAAHRTHAYQRLVRAGWTHRQVTLAITTVNVGLAAAAAVCWHSPEIRMAVLAGAGLVLATLYAAVEWVTAARSGSTR